MFITLSASKYSEYISFVPYKLASICNRDKLTGALRCISDNEKEEEEVVEDT